DSVERPGIDKRTHKNIGETGVRRMLYGIFNVPSSIVYFPDEISDHTWLTVDGVVGEGDFQCATSRRNIRRETGSRDGIDLNCLGEYAGACHAVGGDSQRDLPCSCRRK